MRWIQLICWCFVLGAASAAEPESHWSFQPVKPPEPPVVRASEWVKTPVDRFILAGLERANVPPAPAASKELLVRRVTLDLIGLPPAPSEVERFMNDPSQDAYAKWVDRLLASPQYGERWGRHWLDLARFAESDGFEHDAARPNAWRYRDYVVRSFNADKPYDRFIKEQVAGDELFPDDHDALIATAFNLLGPDMVDSADQVQRRHNTLNDMTDTTALVFLGLTLSCARCHDHKFEPLTQRDYFQLQAFFTPAVFRNDLAIPTSEQRAAFEAAMREFTSATRAIQDAITQVEAPRREQLYQKKLAQLSEEAQIAHKTPKEKRTPEQLNIIQETAELLKISDKELAASMPEAERTQLKELKDRLKAVPKPAPLPATMAIQNGTNLPAHAHILVRGDITRPGEKVEPGLPQVLRNSAGTSRIARPDKPRAALAEWIASSHNPLTARVMANRIWQHHFGRGIVPTPSDFGLHGQRPTHPDLLDWLAAEFVSHGWSIKHLHKLLLLSAAYQQSIMAAPGSIERDPDNRLFSRQNRKRLEGEAIRDSLLAVSGQLNPAMGGPGVFPPIPADVFQGASGWTPNSNPHEYHRRSLYIFARRNLRFPFLEVFDAPDNNLSCPERVRSTSAPQSLALLNSDDTLAAARATAQRIQNQAATRDEQIQLAYRAILSRLPQPAEIALARDFLSHSPLSEFCRALFNLNGFVYVD